MKYNYVVCGYTGICTCMYIMMYIFLLSTANCLSPTYQDHCQFPLHVQAMDPLQSTHTVPLASTLSTALLPRPICLVLHHHSCSPQVLLSFNDHFCVCMPSTSQGHEVGVYICIFHDVLYFCSYVLCFECSVSY